MGSPYRQNMRAQHRENAHRLRYRSASQGWDSAEPGSIKIAVGMTGIGVMLLLGFFLAVLNDSTQVASPLLLFGASLFLFGGVILIFALVEKVFKVFSRRKKHCGCCFFYHPQDGDYDVGLCRADPREGFVQRSHTCPYFRHSERAMVRDRLAQRPEILQQIRVIQIDHQADKGQGSSD